MKEMFKIFLLNKKQQLISIIMFFIVMFSLLMLLNTDLGIKKVIELDIKNAISNRDIYVDLKEFQANEIFNNAIFDQKIEKYYKYLMPIDVLDDKFKNVVLVGTIEEGFPKIKKEIIKKIKDQYVIVPSNYCENVERLLGQKIILKYDNIYSYEAIVGGIYENNSDTITIYTPITPYENFVINNNILSDDNVFHVIVKDQKYMQSIISKLNSMNIEAYPNSNMKKIELKMYENLESVIQKFIILMLLFLTIIFLVIINLVINKEVKFIALLKAIGYKEKNICVILFVIIMLPFIISYILAIIFVICFNVFISYFWHNDLFKYFLFNWKICLFLFLFIVILILFLITIYSLKIRNISIVKLLNYNDC